MRVEKLARRRLKRGRSAKSVANKVLALCGRSCCICHRVCGTKIELHHIEQKAHGGKDTLENCIPLCFDCHSDMGKADPKHPKGKRYSKEAFGVTKRWMIDNENWVPHNTSMSCEEYLEKYEKEAEALNRPATSVWNSYCEFVRQGRRILKL